MNFKIENNYMDITNYPTMAKHFEEMAQKGWMIEKIRLNHIFIYKKIQPQSLDFSVSLYETETEFSRKTKAEQQEFQEVCEMVGWQFVTRNTDFYIYYKSKEVEVVPLQNDPEQELMNLERIGKRMIRSYMILGILFLLISWMNLSQFFNSVDGLLNGNTFWIGFFSPFIVLYFLIEIIRLKSFIKQNKDNFELGKDLNYSKSSFLGNRIAFLVGIIFLIGCIGIIFNGINSSPVVGFLYLPLGLAIVIGLLYRFFIKPSKMSLKTKKKSLVIGLIISVALAMGLTLILALYLIQSVNQPESEQAKKYVTLSIKDYNPDVNITKEYFRKNNSLLYPISYDYITGGDLNSRIKGRIEFEYTKASSEGLAKYLVERYKKQEIKYINQDREEIKIRLSEDIYDEYMFERKAGISPEKFQQLRDLDQEEAITKIIDKTISKQIREELEDTYGVDQSVILNHKNTGIILRKGKEVYYIIGDVDFTEPKVIEITKKKLGL